MGGGGLVLAAEQDDLAAVATASVEMSGGEDGGPLPKMYQLVNPLPFPDGLHEVIEVKF